MPPPIADELFSAFLEYTQAAVAMFDREMRCLCASKQWLKERPVEAVIGRFEDEMRTQQEEWQECASRSLHSGSCEKWQDNSQTPSVLWRFQPWRDRQGEIGGLILSREEGDRAVTPEQDNLEALVQERTAALQSANDQLLSEVIERQQAQTSLAESYSLLQAVMEGTEDAIFLKDAMGRYLLANSATARLLGKRVDQIVGATDRELFESEAEVARSQEIHERVLRTGLSEVTEEAIAVGNQIHSLLTVKSVYRDPEGTVKGVIGVARDISEWQAARREREAALEALRQGKAQFQRLMANVPGMVFQFVLHQDGRRSFSYVSQGCRELFGREPEELLQNSDYAFAYTHPDDRENLERSIFISAQTLQPWNWEGRDVLPSGQIRTIQGVAKPERQPNGDVVWDGLLIDISDRKVAEQALLESETKFRIISELAPVPILIARQHDGLVRYANEQMAQLMGLSVADCIGQLTPNFYANPSERQAILDLFAQQGYVNNYELQLKRANGVLFWVTMSLQTLVLDEEKVILATFYDITERKHSEQTLRHTYQQLVLLKQITQEIRASLDVQHVLKTTVAVVGRAFGVNRCLIHIYTALPEPKVSFVVEYVDEDTAPIVSLKIPLKGNTHMEQILVSDGAIASDNVYQEPLLANAVSLCRDLNLKSMLAVRTSYQGQPNGVLGLHQCDRFRQWTDDEIQMIEAVANQVGVALFQAQLLEQQTQQREQFAQQNRALQQSSALIRRVARREALLNRLSSQIRASLELDTVLEIAVTEIRALLQIDRCQFVWCYLDRDLYCYEAVTESRSAELPSHLETIYLPASAKPEALIAREVLRLDDSSLMSDADLQQFFLDRGYLAVLSLPVQARSGQLGFVHCSHGEVRHWSNEEVELLQAVGDQLAIAIDQAELYKQTRNAAEIATAKTEELKLTLQELTQMQGQLIQSEKMSSLGQMVAGVAHEINNPVSFIYGNVGYAIDQVTDLLELLQLYQQCYPEPVPIIQERVEACELDFLIEDLPKLLTSMKVGADRINEIVRSLRTFSRLDEAEKKEVDIHECLDSTLMILDHRLNVKSGHPAIALVKRYGDLPLVECYAGQLNQVFMNLLTNAIDALELSGKSQPKIEIRTEKCPGERIAIAIADNGTGIPEEIQSKLFEPFFTTKPIGSGTGLGLAISYQIVVEKHSGQLRCYSNPGEGTEFVIEIPIKQLEDNS